MCIYNHIGGGKVPRRQPRGNGEKRAHYPPSGGPTVPTPLRICFVAPFLLASPLVRAAAQSPTLYAGMHWRHIGPFRAGRARAVVGVPSQPNIAYIGFDNGGVWRSTDYGSTWVPLFDDQPTG